MDQKGYRGHQGAPKECRESVGGCQGVLGVSRGVTSDMTVQC